MRAAAIIATKDLRQRLRDRSALMVAIVLPLALAFIYSSLFGPASAPVSFRYAVVDADGGPVAQGFTTGVLEQVERAGVITVRRSPDAATATELVTSGAVDAAFILPAGLSAAVAGRAPAGVDVVGSVDSPTATDVARSIARSYVADVNSVRLALATAVPAERLAQLPPEQLSQLAGQAAATTQPVALRDVSAATKVLGVKEYLAAGMSVFFLFFTVQFGVTSLLDERAQGTLARLLSTPIRPGSVLAGKLLASVVLGLISMATLVAATTWLMRISWGNPVGVALLVLGGVLAATGMMSLIASVARTPDQAGGWQAVVAVLLGLLGGAFFPIAQIGGVVGTVSLATPHAWFLRGLGELAAGGGPLAVLPALGAMLAFAAATLGLALLRLRAAVRP